MQGSKTFKNGLKIHKKAPKSKKSKKIRFTEAVYSTQTKQQRTYNLVTSLSEVRLEKLVNGGPHFDDSKWGSVAGSNKF